jgi:hypothetical protein
MGGGYPRGGELINRCLAMNSCLQRRRDLGHDRGALEKAEPGRTGSASSLAVQDFRPISSTAAAGTDAATLPGGYVPVAAEGRRGVARDWAAAVVDQILDNSTLQDWAATQPARETLHGRGVVYAVTLPAGTAAQPTTPVVVRRNRHGGLLRWFTREYFLRPTRAPLELAASARLAEAGVPTPELIAYAVYPATGWLARCDVMTRRLPEGAELPAAWRTANAATREALLRAVAALLEALRRAQAWHPDLNLKNIYLTGQGLNRTAYVLDVDRVVFADKPDLAALNLNRLRQSARKWRRRWGLDFGEDALERLAALSRAHA